MSWWSSHYNRPLKDPMLLEYTVEELAYEYFNVIERRKAEEERIQAENDKIEEAKRQKAENWADQMEAEEAAMEAQESTPVDPASDPETREWMDRMIEENKKEFGETFGEDLSFDFGN